MESVDVLIRDRDLSISENFASFVKTKQEKLLDKHQKIDLEIKKLQEHIDAKVNEREKQDEKTTREVTDFARKIQKYSTFKKKEILDILTELVTLYYGEEYASGKFEVECINTLLIYPCRLKGKVSKKRWNELINYGEVISLEEIEYDENLVFYCWTDAYVGEMEPNVEVFSNKGLEKIPFLQEFIEYVLLYRLQNDVKEISVLELKKLQQQFVINKSGEIFDHHNYLKQKDLDEIKLKNQMRNFILEDYISKNIDGLDGKEEDITRKLLKTNEETKK